MAYEKEKETIDGYTIEINPKDLKDPYIERLIRGWKAHYSAFHDARAAIKNDSNHEMYVGDKSNIVFEYKGGKYKLRRSTSR